MRRFFLIVFLSLALSACAPETPAPLPIVTVPPTPTFDPQAYTDSCAALTSIPTAMPEESSFFPPVSRADFSFGREDAPVTIIEYCDFQSGGCRAMSAVIARLMKERDTVRFIFRPVPLIGQLDKSELAIIAALAADEQGKFWTMYDFLFVTYPTWDALAPEAFNAWVVKESAQVGIDAQRLESALNDPKTRTRMMSIYEPAKALNIPVPLVLVNGNPQQLNMLNYETLSEMVDLIALGEKQFKQCPPFEIDRLKQYIATIYTDKGEIVLQLYADKAPLAVNSFVFLARQGWFDGVTFHRVIPGFVAQAGDPSGTGKGNPGYFFNNESSNLLFDQPGIVAMANSGPDTNGSQFFITFAPLPHLDGGYTIFGNVISGLDVAENLTPRDSATGNDILDGDRIIRVEIEER